MGVDVSRIEDSSWKHQLKYKYQVQWPCGKSGCGTHCFVNGQGEHIMLSHKKIEVWANGES
jgi:hypothetical protein